MSIRTPFPKLKRERLPERKAMTIGVGFVCSNGIVICADRRITGQDVKYRQCKVKWSQCVPTGDAFIFSYAGTPIVAATVFRMLKDHLFEELRKSKKHFAHEKAMEVLPRFLKGKKNKNLELLIGVVVGKGEPFLLRTWGVEIEMVFDSEFIGFGDSSALRYLKSFFLPDDLSPNIDEAEILASYVVHVASEFVPYCGGGQDYATLQSGGGVSQGTGNVYPNQEKRFLVCEQEIGKSLRELLISGGTK